MKLGCGITGLAVVPNFPKVTKRTGFCQRRPQAKITFKTQNQNGLWTDLILRIQFGPRAYSGSTTVGAMIWGYNLLKFQNWSWIPTNYNLSTKFNPIPYWGGIATLLVMLILPLIFIATFLQCLP